MPALLNCPKMSRAMWDALKAHIMKERQKKKQEQEADAAIERQRRERENKQKQDVMTLEETKEQIQQLEQRLSQLKEEKHQLFLQLKKVLNEDEIRRRAIPKEANDFLSFGAGYPPHTVQLGGHPPMFMQAGRSPMYKIGAHHQQTLIPPGSLKRARSPSPPPSGYTQSYNLKAQAVAAYNQKPNQFSAQAGPYYHHPSSQSHSSSASTFAPVGQTVYTYASHPQYQATPSQHSQTTPTTSDQPGKHVQHSYHVQHLQQQSYATPIHQQLEQASQKAGFSEEKYFGVQQHPGVSMRGVNPMHHPQTLIPLQQQTKTGGITSGYPVRGQPTAVTSAAAYSTQAQQHVTYSGQQTGPRHAYTNQPPSRYY